MTDVPDSAPQVDTGSVSMSAWISHWLIGKDFEHSVLHRSGSPGILAYLQLYFVLIILFLGDITSS